MWRRETTESLFESDEARAERALLEMGDRSAAAKKGWETRHAHGEHAAAKSSKAEQASKSATDAAGHQAAAHAHDDAAMSHYSAMKISQDAGDTAAVAHHTGAMEKHNTQSAFHRKQIYAPAEPSGKRKS